MIWDSDSNQIYVLLASGDWQAYEDTFVEDRDPAWDVDLPPPPLQSQRGFGKVWREQLGGPRSVLGWALEGERAVDGWRQRFESGMLFWTDAAPGGSGDAGIAYLLYKDGTWRAVPATRPRSTNPWPRVRVMAGKRGPGLRCGPRSSVGVIPKNRGL